MFEHNFLEYPKEHACPYTSLRFIPRRCGVPEKYASLLKDSRALSLAHFKKP
jgi:hypothetical protein